MAIVKYGAPKEERSKTAAGAPGTRNVERVETLKEKLAREKREKGSK